MQDIKIVRKMIYYGYILSTYIDIFKISMNMWLTRGKIYAYQLYKWILEKK